MKEMNLRMFATDYAIDQTIESLDAITERDDFADYLKYAKQPIIAQALLSISAALEDISDELNYINEHGVKIRGGADGTET